MIKGKKVIAVIPARGGSKRLPNKNKRPFHNKPLIEWTIDEAKKSEYIDEIVVTTDDIDILMICDMKAIKTVKRPDYLCTDKSSTRSAIQHVLTFYEGFDYVVVLQPTSPLRTVEDIDHAIEFLTFANEDSLVTTDENGNHNGAVYVLRIQCLYQLDTCEKSIQMRMKNFVSVDIDTEADFELAEKRYGEILQRLRD